MLIEDLYESFVESYNEGDIKSASLALMKELGNILVKQKIDFVNLLNESGVPASIEMNDSELVNLFIKNIDTNKKLMLGSALLVNMHNKQMGFDGDEEINDDGVKAAFAAIDEYFNFGEDEYSNAVSGAVVGAVAQGVGELSKLGTTALQGRQKKKYGALDIAKQKSEAKAAMTQQILAQRQAQIEAAQKEKDTKAKTTRTLLIVGGAILGIAILGIIIYKVRKKN